MQQVPFSAQPRVFNQHLLPPSCQQTKLPKHTPNSTVKNTNQSRIQTKTVWKDKGYLASRAETVK
eukprot:2716391-Amphidinium_carterae.1